MDECGAQENSKYDISEGYTTLLGYSRVYWKAGEYTGKGKPK